MSLKLTAIDPQIRAGRRSNLDRNGSNVDDAMTTSRHHERPAHAGQVGVRRTPVQTVELERRPSRGAGGATPPLREGVHARDHRAPGRVIHRPQRRRLQPIPRLTRAAGSVSFGGIDFPQTKSLHNTVRDHHARHTVKNRRMSLSTPGGAHSNRGSNLEAD